MKTLVQILPSLDQTGGGVERGTLDIAKCAAENSYKSVIISSGGDMSQKYKHKGVLHIDIPLQKKNLYYYYLARKKFRKVLEEIKPDLVHIRSRWPAFCFNNLVKFKIPLITTYHGTYSGNNFSLKKRYNGSMVQGDRVIAISNFISDHVLKNFPLVKKKLVTISRGIDIHYFDIDSINTIRKENFLRKLSISDNKHIILLPGRLTEWKGHFIAIEAAKILIQKYPDLNFLMLFVGSEQKKKRYRRRLEDRIRRNNLSERVFLTGPKTDMPVIYSLSDVVLSTSIEEEAFGRVSAEASAMSKPIIATNIGGSKDIIINKKTGWLIHPQDPTLLADTISKIINKTQKEKDEIGRKARKRIEQKFSLNLMLNKTFRLYEELLNEKYTNY